MFSKAIDKYSDDHFIEIALKEARKAFKKDEVPIGAVIVSKDGKIIAKAHNLVESNNCQNSHAEILAIKKATKVINDWRLQGCTLYVTLQPCSMCMGLILLSRIESLVFSTDSNIYGFNVEKCFTFDLYKCPINIRQGVHQEKSVDLLKQFFKAKRIKNERQKNIS